MLILYMYIYMYVIYRYTIVLYICAIDYGLTLFYFFFHTLICKIHTLICKFYTLICKIYILICKIHNLICKSWIGSGPAEHPRTIVTKFGFNWSSSSRGEDLWMKSWRRTDDGRTEGRTPDAKWWQKLILDTARWAKKSRQGQICQIARMLKVAEGIMFWTSPRVSR